MWSACVLVLCSIVLVHLIADTEQHVRPRHFVRKRHQRNPRAKSSWAGQSFLRPIPEKRFRVNGKRSKSAEDRKVRRARRAYDDDRSYIHTSDDVYPLNYETDYVYQGVDEFGAQVKYNKTEHVYYGDNYIRFNEEDAELLEDMHRNSVNGSYLFPHVDINGEWKIERLSREQMYPRDGAKYRYITNPKADFFLYTRDASSITKISTEEELANSDYNSSKQTVFLIHGWRSGKETSDIFPEIRKAYLQVDDYNVFTVDWHNSANTLNYYLASERTKQIGKRIASFIRMLVQCGTSLNNVKLVGHSLGAHAAGFAGKRLGGRLGSIVGLDPPLLLFSGNEDKRLNKHDAKYVEVGHSSAVSVPTAIGHADFYFNGGYNQPACWKLDIACDHSIINEYFKESIVNPDGFKVQKCFNLSQMNSGKCASAWFHPKHRNGEESNGRLRGIFNVRTGSTTPYAIN